MRKLCSILVSACLACALVPALVACSGSDAGKSVAATVNGEDIYEEDVTLYVEQLRTYYGCAEDADWAQFMVSYGYTASDVRDMAIDALAQEIIVEQKCDELGITVTDEEIDENIAEIREQNGYTDDESWALALESAGYDDPAEYREVVRTGMLQEKLCEAEVETSEPDEAVVVATASSYVGQKASHILVADEQTANEICDRINAADDKDEAFADELSASLDTGDMGVADEEGNVGWTSVNYYAYLTVLPNTFNALVDMEPGDCQVIEEADGYHVVYCTDVFSVDDPSTLTKKDIPADLYDFVAEQVSAADYGAACSEYLQGLVAEADIQKNEMPEGLSYDIDVSAAEAGTGTEIASTTFYADENGTYYYDEYGNKIYLDIAEDPAA